MKAKTSGICVVCNKPIKIGQDISWTRRGLSGSAKGKYHTSCRDPHTPVKIIGVDTVIPVEVIAVDTAVVAKLTSGLPKLTRTSKWWDIMAHSLRYLNRVILIGPPGTGKSTTAMKVCGIKHRITMTESTTREDLIGMFHLINGETKWVDGPVVQAMRLGVPVLIDEIDRYSQEVASMLYSILDDSPHVDLPTGEIVHANPGYKVVMTSNEQPDMLPAAIFDRIEGIFIADVPHTDSIGHLDRVNQAVVRNFYQSQPKPVIKTTPTVRRIRAFHTLMTNGMEDHAASVVFSSSAKEIESAIANVKSSQY
jgi:MoxR-like ATPase